MKYGKFLFIGLLFLAFFIPSSTFAQVEVFSATLIGTRTCGDFNVTKIKQTVFVEISPGFIDIFADAALTNLLAELEIFEVYQTGITTFAFSAFESGFSFEAVTGTGKFNTSGIVSFLGTFNQMDLGGCFSNGTIKSVRRLS